MVLLRGPHNTQASGHVGRAPNATWVVSVNHRNPHTPFREPPLADQLNPCYRSSIRGKVFGANSGYRTRYPLVAVGPSSSPAIPRRTPPSELLRPVRLTPLGEGQLAHGLPSGPAAGRPVHQHHQHGGR